MKAFINTHALSAERFDSARLTVLAMIAHPLSQTGTYSGTILAGEIEMGRFMIETRPEHPLTQINLDLAKTLPRISASDRQPAAYKLKTGGYLMLLVSEGPGGFRVRLERAADEKKARDKSGSVFDSARLGKGDLFLVTPLRPGKWRMSEPGRGAEGTMTVAYPVLGKTPHRPDGPVRIKLADRAFEPAKVQIGPAQTVVFEIDAEPVSVVVTLSAPDDGKPDRRPPPDVRRRVRWTNPSPKGPPRPPK